MKLSELFITYDSIAIYKKYHFAVSDMICDLQC